ncbi:polysaccharide deacetylase family protein [Halobacteriovorax sp. GB3]|uniref:polysaccharide deacetylase family protein n=1 Tax=Halobacteriovorax sp. GB3 TaxID=2719615 RepID=UPI00235EDCAF|nr:polysaccharide deacetylase family protein [Halobacteriovorax sp. GB3]MDD0852517.1 polysaccharide deacetylase family protein [Halobacteriovorax sp. GB3]
MEVRKIKKVIKRAGAFAYSTFNKKSGFEKHIPILYYHSIGKSLNREGLRVDTDEFEKQIKYLVENYIVVHLDEIANLVKSSKNAHKYAAVTFDDGYKDNFDVAYPILKKYNCPATIFIASGFVKKEVEFTEGGEKLIPLELNDIKSMNDDLVRFEAHTHTHISLNEITLDEVTYELERSVKEIEQMCGRKPTHFAYPNGAINKDILKRVEDVGFKSAYATFMSTEVKCEDLFCIPRVMIDMDDTLKDAVCKIEGAYNYLGKMQKGKTDL